MVTNEKVKTQSMGWDRCVRARGGAINKDTFQMELKTEIFGEEYDGMKLFLVHLR